MARPGLGPELGRRMVASVFPKLRSPEHDARTQDNVDVVLRPVAQALAQTPIMGAAAPAWVAPSLLNGFTNTGGARALAGIHKDALGYVHGQGALTHAAGTAAGTQILLLASGYRPRNTIRIAVPVTPGAQWVEITPSGVLTTGFAIAAAGEIELSFIFLAEQ